MVFKKDKRHLKKKNIPLRNCEICNKIIPRNTKFGEKRIVPVQYIKTRFCSRKCKGIHHSQILQSKNNPNWQGGKSFEPYSVDWTQTLKRSIRERDNYICRICNQYGSSVHHKDYDKKNCDPKNLITLCVKCHTKTNHNRDYWLDYFKYYAI